MTPTELTLTALIILGILGIAAGITAIIVFGNKSPWDKSL